MKTPATTPTPAFAPVAARRRGFSLIEILVVMGIIVLLIALALPAFNFITGSRSVEAATNVVGSSLSVARAEAVGLQQIRGVSIYHDNVSDRDTIALVELRTYPFPAYVAGTPGSPPVAVNYRFGQYVTVGSGATAISYVCIEAYADIGGTPPASTPLYWRAMPDVSDANRGSVPAIAVKSFIEVVPGSTRQVLPVGVSARGVGNQATVLYPAVVGYRYFSPATVLFDANGAVVVSDFGVSLNGILGKSIDLPNYAPQPRSASECYASNYTTKTLPDTTVVPAQPIQSQIGLALFDSEIFRNGTTSFNPKDATATLGQPAIDNWLDTNATPSMVNRVNGTLVKGE